MQNPIHLYDLGYPTAVRRCLGFHEDAPWSRPRFPWVGTTARGKES